MTRCISTILPGFCACLKGSADSETRHVDLECCTWWLTVVTSHRGLWSSCSIVHWIWVPVCLYLSCPCLLGTVPVYKCRPRCIAGQLVCTAATPGIWAHVCKGGCLSGQMFIKGVQIYNSSGTFPVVCERWYKRRGPRQLLWPISSVWSLSAVCCKFSLPAYPKPPWSWNMVEKEWQSLGAGWWGPWLCCTGSQPPCHSHQPLDRPFHCGL